MQELSFTKSLVVLLFVPLFSSGQQLCINSWKKPKQNTCIGAGALVTVSWKETQDSVRKECRVHGYVNQVSKGYIGVSPMQLTVSENGASVQRNAMDTGAINNIQIALGSIDYFSTFSSRKRESKSLEAVPMTLFAATFGLAPIISVNHIKGTVNSSLYGWLLLGGYLVPYIAFEVIDGLNRGRHKQYYIVHKQPSAPMSKEYYLQVK